MPDAARVAALAGTRPVLGVLERDGLIHAQVRSVADVAALGDGYVRHVYRQPLRAGEQPIYESSAGDVRWWCWATERAC